MINAFKYTKQLEQVGFSREQAEAQLQVMSEIVVGDLATKQDLQLLKQDLQSLKQEFKQDLKLLETTMENKFQHVEDKFQQLEYKITIKLGTLLIIGFTTLATLMKFWSFR